MAKSIASDLDGGEFAQALHQSRNPLTIDWTRVRAQDPDGRQLRALLRCTKIKFAFSLQLSSMMAIDNPRLHEKAAAVRAKLKHVIDQL